MYKFNSPKYLTTTTISNTSSSYRKTDDILLGTFEASPQKVYAPPVNHRVRQILARFSSLGMAG